MYTQVFGVVVRIASMLIITSAQENLNSAGGVYVASGIVELKWLAGVLLYLRTRSLGGGLVSVDLTLSGRYNNCLICYRLENRHFTKNRSIIVIIIIIITTCETVGILQYCGVSSP